MSAREPDAPAEVRSCGCTVGGLHRYACASVGYVDPAPAVTEEVDQ